ncbi:riboflavin synthase domain-like protein [Trametopsis cervina]|nr:riboflavin synthase domain-like protein [Trametopsis cervina]
MTIHHHDSEGEDGREITILYATETGNAQDVAERLARLCRRLHFDVQVASLDEYEADSLFSVHTVIFVIATSGTGREPRSMTAFWLSILRSDLPSDLFDHLDFAVFGLGDTAYEKFCWPAKLLERRLLSLGANQLIERGDADDQHQLGIDGALDPWIEKLSTQLLVTFPLPPGVAVLPDGKPLPRVHVVEGYDPSIAVGRLSISGKQDYLTATIARNDRITAQDWYQDVRHFDLDFDEDLDYNAGDIAVIHPHVSAEEVDSFLAGMGWTDQADDLFTIKHVLPEQSLPPRMPSTVSLRLLFTQYLDINAVPRKSFFALLRHFTTEQMESDKLDEFLIGPYAADDLFEYCTSVRRSIREVLEEFRSAKIPREYLFDLFPVLRPREFSIASSVRRHPRRIQLCVAIVSYRTKLRVVRRGVATTYLASLQPGTKLDIRLKKGFFRLPQDPSTPVICIGPGTGIAPARSIIEERIAWGAYDNTLYQGCRSASKDQHYKDDFTTLATEKNKGGNKLVYRVACSRDGPPGFGRTYVQHLIREDSERIWDIVGTRKGSVYISGSSNKMPAGVRIVIQEAIVKHGGKGEEEAKEFVNQMEREGRLVEDCWD